MAHEHVVCQLSLLLYRLLPPGSASVMHQGTKASAPFPGLDPALSDLFSAELELALDRLAGMQNRLSESAQSQPTKRS